MSLTSHLKDPASSVRRFLHERFPDVQWVIQPANKLLADVATIRPAGPVPWNTIGTALDYRLRFYFSAAPLYDLVAWKGAHLCGAVIDPILREDLRRFYGSLLEDNPRWVLSPELGWEFFLGPLQDPKRAREFELVVGWEPRVPGSSGATEGGLEDVLRQLRPAGRRLDGPQEELLCRYCVVLALFEELFRATNWAAQASPLFAPQAKATLAELLAIPPQHWLDDLRELSWAFYEQFHEVFSRPHVAVPNPSFEGSVDVGGADADLIVDGCLFDIKTTVTSRIEPSWLYQLVGYALLDYGDRYRIREVALYLARQAVTLRWPLDELMWRMAGVPRLAVKVAGRRLTPVDPTNALPSLTDLRAHFRSVSSAATH